MAKKLRKRIIMKFFLFEPKDDRIKVEGELDEEAFDNEKVRKEIIRLLNNYYQENPATNKLTLRELFSQETKNEIQNS